MQRLFLQALMLLTTKLLVGMPATPPISLIVFSYDRPLQLYSFLHSLQKHTTGLQEIMVIYRTSTPEFQAGYEQLWQSALIKQSRVPVRLFPQATAFGPVSTTPRTAPTTKLPTNLGTPAPAAKAHLPNDFRNLTLKALAQAPEYVVFAVDDNLVIRPVDFSACVQALATTNAHSFSLRLGKNIRGSAVAGELNGQPQFRHFGLPQFETVPNLPADMLAWRLDSTATDSDWHYSCTVDMNIYRTKNVIQELRTLNPTRFTSPRFEGDWGAQQRLRRHGQRYLCFTESKIVNIPLNKVRPESSCYAQNIDTKYLLQLFQQQYYIDLAPLEQLQINSPHLAYVPTFVQFDIPNTRVAAATIKTAELKFDREEANRR